MLEQEYVKGLSNPEEVVRLRIPLPMYDEFYGEDGKNHFDLERQTAAQIVFHSKEVLEISGCITGVSKAAMIIEELINMFIQTHDFTGSELTTDDTPDEESPGLAGVSLAVSSDRNFLGTEDGEFCENCSLNTHKKEQNVHLQSTDLAASSIDNNEASDVRSILLTEDPAQKACTCHERTCVSSDPNVELMEFGIKLGYSEDEIKSAMKKLGSETAVNKNELLHELVKASQSAKQIGRPGNDDSIKGTENFLRPQDASLLRHIVMDGSNVAMR